MISGEWPRVGPTRGLCAPTRFEARCANKSVLLRVSPGPIQIDLPFYHEPRKAISQYPNHL